MNALLRRGLYCVDVRYGLQENRINEHTVYQNTRGVNRCKQIFNININTYSVWVFVESCANLITRKMLFFLETIIPTECKKTVFQFLNCHLCILQTRY